MVVSGQIHYKNHQIDFEVNYQHEDISESGIRSEEAKHGLIHAINRKFRVKYPLSSEIDQIRVSRF
ncbi:hypothetical protein [Halobacillus halophilus]|uniref:hypothetical protein n=1 Tax=Halobacillus halophilus TaxID=1570 RepID=UPI001CD7F42C|nr:hypothetical protein [Halobacillus halophilus]MCA1010431.1 hypothetical protein [Halobacillus halophilus]